MNGSCMTMQHRHRCKSSGRNGEATALARSEECPQPIPPLWLAILGLILASGCLSMLMAIRAPQALAASDDGHDDVVMERDHQLSHSKKDDVNYMVDKTTKRVLYCIQPYAEQPKSDALLPYGGFLANLTGSEDYIPFSNAKVAGNNEIRSDFPEMLRAFDYIAYHGYSGDTSITLGQFSGDGDQLYLATQLAIYRVMYNDSSEVVTELVRVIDSKAVVDAADALYQQAMSYANSNQKGPEDHTAIWYRSKDNACQNVLTRVPKGRIHVSKESVDPEVSSGNGSYSLEGAEFTIALQSEPDVILDTIVTDAEGKATSKELSYGEYVLRETKAPQGFAVSVEEADARITGGPVNVTIAESPLYVFAGTLLAKVDRETNLSEPLGAATLSGARFTVSYYAGSYDQEHFDPTSLPSIPTRSWMLVTDDEGAIALDAAHLDGENNPALYVDHSGNACLPLGVVRIEEAIPPEGYELPDDPVRYRVIDSSMAGQTLSLEQDSRLPEPVVRGDISFDKVEEGSGRTMPGVLFRVMSQSTGESHIIMTDEAGHFSSTARPHTGDTNALDAAVDERDTVDEAKAVEPCGSWFYGYSADDESRSSVVEDDCGAFPYDTYVFQELASAATVGHALTSFTVTVSKNDETVDYGKVSDASVTLKTAARDGSDGDKYLIDDGAHTIIDTVSYEGLDTGCKYTLTCTLVAADTGSIISDTNGNPFSASCTFTPSDSKGSKEVTVDIDTSQVDVSRIVAYERLTMDGKLIVSHEDPNDPEQTVYLPRISTMLTDATDGDQTIPSDSPCTLKDSVRYEGLVPGETYTIEGTIFDKQSNQALTDSNGQEISAKVDLIPTSPDGEAEVTFELATDGLADHQLVAFETVMHGDKELCFHNDFEDARQTVSIVRSVVSLPNTGGRGFVLVTLMGLLSIASGTLGRRALRRLG